MTSSLKEASYTDKFSRLQPWLSLIVTDVKKDLKNDHLKADINFLKQNFGNKPRVKLTVEEMVPAYQTALTSGEHENLAEFVANRWLIGNTDLYDYFSSQLSAITTDFEDLALIEDDKGKPMVDGAVAQFGAIKTLLFCTFNSVVVSDGVISELSAAAEEELATKPNEEKESIKSIEDLQKKHERELKRLEDRYEKKLSGMTKKYDADVAALKKQISALHKKLS